MSWLLFKRDLLLAFRRGGGSFSGLAFALMSFVVFAFGLGPEALVANAKAVLPVIVVLSCLVSLPALLEKDHDDGTLEQYLLQPVALEWMMLSKLMGFWLTATLPLALLSPLLSLMAEMKEDAALKLAALLVPGTLALSAIGLVGAALTLGMRRSGILQAIILLPLYCPVMIFIAGGHMLLLYSAALITVPLSCLAAAALVRLAAE